MHVPSDRPLASWIRELYAADKIYVFYNSPEWKALRHEVLEDHGFECEACADHGIYVRADTVHHEYHVHSHPGMALTRYVELPDGTRREVLHPLCNSCHNAAHGRFDGPRHKPKGKPVTKERWD